jgi:hypothetical protein
MFASQEHPSTALSVNHEDLLTAAKVFTAGKRYYDLEMQYVTSYTNCSQIKDSRYMRSQLAGTTRHATAGISQFPWNKQRLA